VAVDLPKGLKRAYIGEKLSLTISCQVNSLRELKKGNSSDTGGDVETLDSA